MTNTETNFKQILKKIRLYENGSASELLINSGLKYNQVFGLSIPNMKTIAKEYKPNHELALKLRDKNYRETQILASMLDLVSLEDFDYINELVNSVDNIELAEQLVINELADLDFALDLVEHFIKSEKEFVISAAYILLSRIILKNKQISEDDFSKIIQYSQKHSLNSSLHVKRSISRAYRQIASVNSEYKDKVISLFESLKKSHNNPNIDFIYEEIVPLIMYS